MLNNHQTEIGAMSEIEAERLSRNWWILLTNGILSIIAGILILSIPWTFASLTFFVGAILIVRGILQAFSPPRAGSTRAWNAGIGILSALVGISIIAFPSFAALSLITLALFIGIWLIVSGIAETISSISNRISTRYWWLGVAGGVLSVILGVFALYRPLLTLAALVFVIGIWAIVIGTMEIALAFEIKNLPKAVRKETTQQAKPRKTA